jgi:hypothetical protein
MIDYNSIHIVRIWPLGDQRSTLVNRYYITNCTSINFDHFALSKIEKDDIVQKYESSKGYVQISDEKKLG